MQRFTGASPGMALPGIGRSPGMTRRIVTDQSGGAAVGAPAQFDAWYGAFDPSTATVGVTLSNGNRTALLQGSNSARWVWTPLIATTSASALRIVVKLDSRSLVGSDQYEIGLRNTGAGSPRLSFNGGTSAATLANNTLVSRSATTISVGSEIVFDVMPEKGIAFVKINGTNDFGDSATFTNPWAFGTQAGLTLFLGGIFPSGAGSFQATIIQGVAQPITW